MTVELYSQDSIFNAGLTSVQAITQLIDPVYDTDVATKYYVDHAIDILQTDPRFDTSVTPLTAIPIATDEVLGGVKIGKNLTIALDGTLSFIPQDALPLSGGTITGTLNLLSSLRLPNNQVINTTTQPFLTSVALATNTTAGIVKIGSGVFVSDSGVISVTQFNGLSSTGGNVNGNVNVLGVLSAYELKGSLTDLPAATNNTAGCIRVGSNLYIDDDNRLNAFAPFVLAPASTNSLGGVVIGSGINVDANGTISTSSLPLSGGVLTDALTGTRATFTASLSSPALSGTFYGDGSKLSGVIASGGTATDSTKLPLNGGTLSGPLRGLSATFTTYVSSPALSGTFYGDGSKLTGVISSGGTATDSTKLPLNGGSLSGPLTGTVGVFSASLSAPNLSGTYYGDGSNLTGVIKTQYVPPAEAVFTTSLSAPSVSGVFYGDGSKLTGVPIYNAPSTATFTTSISSPAVSGGSFYGDGSKLTGITLGDFLSASGGTLSGSLIVRDNLTIQGNLTAAGTSTFVNTTFTTTSALSVVNTTPASGIPALYIGQSGPSDIASFYDIDQGIEVLHVGGVNSLNPNVGVHTSTPNKTLTVNGEISARNDIWTGGKFRGDGSLLTGISVGGVVDSTKLPLSGGTLTDSLTGTRATFTVSISSPALSGTFYGDGSRLTGVVAAGGTASDPTKLPLTGGTLTGNLYQGGTGYFYGDAINLALRPPTNGAVYLQSNDGLNNWLISNNTGTTIYNFLTIGRQDNSQEGGQIGLCRASDNTVNWNIDVFGAGSTPRLRIHKDLGGEKMTILDNGNVGIGTSAPQSKLTVLGDISVGGLINTGSGVTTSDCAIEVGGTRTGNGNAYVDLHSTSNTDYEARFLRAGGVNGDLFIVNTGTGNFNLYQQGSGPIVFGTSNIERVRITTNGNVGIGETIPKSTLHVNGVITLGSYQGINSTDDTTNLFIGGGSSWSKGAAINLYGSNSGFMVFSTGTGVLNSERMRLSELGNLGIGTNNPTSKLEVNGVITTNNNNYGVLRLGNTDNTGWLVTKESTDNTFNIWQGAVIGSSTNRLKIAANGNVGIGTITPSRKLSVEGDVSFTGYIYGDGSKLTGISQGTTGNFIPTTGGNLTGTITGVNEARIVFENSNVLATVTFAGNMLNIRGSADGIQTAASFDYPESMVKDVHGNLFIADTYNHSIRKITPSGVVTTIAGINNVYGITNGPGTAARFRGPKGITIDSAGNIFVADTGNHVIRKLTKEQNDTYTVTTFAGTAGIAGTTNGTGTSARFHSPTSITIDSSDRLYVSSMQFGSSGNIIRSITSQAVVTTFAGGGSDLSPNSTATTCRFATSIIGGTRLAIDSSNNIIYADNYRVVKITQAGVVSTLIGTNTTQVSHLYSAAAVESTYTDNGNGLIAPTQIIHSVFIDKTNGDKLYIGSVNLLQTIERIGVSTSFRVRNIIANGVTASDTLLNSTRTGFIKTILLDNNNKITYLDGSYHRIVKITYAQTAISAAEGLITPVVRAGKLFGDGSGLASVYLKTGGELDGPLYSTSEATFGRVSVGVDGDQVGGAHIIAGMSDRGVGDITITGKYTGDGSGLQNVLPLTGGTINGSLIINNDLTVNGKITAKGDISTESDIIAFSTSDRTLKENIVNIPDSLKKLTQINGVYFNWKDRPENQGLDVGVIAQDVEKILPEIVTTRTNGYKAVQYDKLIPLLIESIKDLKEQVDDLKNQLKNK